MDSTLVIDILQSIVHSVMHAEAQITKYDTIAGDGDCGETLLRGVIGIAIAIHHAKTMG